MNREHIFNIAVSFDEDAVRQRAEEYISKELSDGIAGCYFKKNGGYYRQTHEPTQEMDTIVADKASEFILANSERILSMVVEAIANKVYRSKAFKEKYGEIEGGKDNE